MPFRMTRRALLLPLAAAILSVASNSALAGGNPEAGKQKSIFCAYCHGSDGNPLDAGAPRLAGQDAAVLVTKMKHQTRVMGQHELMIQAFRTGRALNDQDMNDLAAYFSGQPVRQTANTAVAPQSARQAPSQP